MALIIDTDADVENIMLMLVVVVMVVVVMCSGGVVVGGVAVCVIFNINVSVD